MQYIQTFESFINENSKARDVIDRYPKGSLVNLEEILVETGDTVIDGILSDMKQVFNNVKISGKRPNEGAAFYNWKIKEIDINKNSPYWDTVGSEEITAALAHEFVHHLIDTHSSKSDIEEALQEIKDKLISDEPGLNNDQKISYGYMTAKTNSPQEVLTYAVSDPKIRPILAKYKNQLNKISNKIINKNII